MSLVVWQWAASEFITSVRPPVRKRPIIAARCKDDPPAASCPSKNRIIGSPARFTS